MKFKRIDILIRTYFKNTSVRDMSQFPQDQGATTNAYIDIRRGGATRRLRKLVISLRVAAIFLYRFVMPHRSATSTASSAGLADTRKSFATRAGGIFEMGSSAFAILILLGGIFVVGRSGFLFFTKAQTSTEAISISITIPGPTPTPAPTATPTQIQGGGGGGGGVVYVPAAGPAKIIFKGYAYPFAFITFSRNESVIGTAVVGADGLFEKKIDTFSGLASFGFWARDPENMHSPTISLSISVPLNAEVTVSNILIPPTISLNKGIFLKGEDLKLAGFGYPGGPVQVFINSTNPILQQSTPAVNGKWLVAVPTEELDVGKHTAKARSQIDPSGLISQFSEELLFQISGECAGPDLNFGGKVNITDFSILLYYWDQTKPKNKCADLNGDGKVNLIDFSIMLYYWTEK